MKIAFIISSIYSKSRGNGGHYHSLLTLYKAMSDKNELLIINIGTSKSDTLEKENINLYNILSPSLDYKNTKNKISLIIKGEKPDLLHSFDHQALFWARVASNKFKIPYCLTKCGGGNPKSYFPFCNNIVLFSRENYKYFTTSNKFKNSNIQLIPNRVSPFNLSIDRTNHLLEDYPAIDKFDFKFLRICRIGKAYRKSLIQSIELINLLNTEKYSCCLVIIGVVENQEILSEIKALSKGNNIIFITASKYTKNAKELLGFSDFVLGTGRSFMEASSHSKILLSPIKNSDIPLLVTEQNIKNVLDYNISERLDILDYDRNLNFKEIKSILDSPLNFNNSSVFSKSVFKTYFNIEKVLSKYQLYYENLKLDKKMRLFDFFLHFIYLKRAYKNKN